MSIFDWIGNFFKGVKQIANIGPNNMILALQSENRELNQQLQDKGKVIAALNETVKELQTTIATKAKMVFNGKVYKQIGESGKESKESFCPRCYDGSGKVCNLQYSAAYEYGSAFNYCPVCEKQHPA